MFGSSSGDGGGAGRRSAKMEEKIAKLRALDIAITEETGDWICHLDGLWMGSTGPRFSMMVVDNAKGMHEERMPASHKEWLENHECWLCDDSVDEVPERVKNREIGGTSSSYDGGRHSRRSKRRRQRKRRYERRRRDDGFLF